MIFTADCTNFEIKNETIESSIDLSNFIPKTITLNGEAIIDENERKCVVNTKKFKLNFQTSDHLPNGINLEDNEWELLAYEEGGFFNKHTDRKRSPDHKYTALLYIQSNYTGGEMIIYNGYSQTEFIFENIDRPVLLIFDINMIHESRPVISGVKLFFKTAVTCSNEILETNSKQFVVGMNDPLEDYLDIWRRENRENSTDDLED